MKNLKLALKLAVGFGLVILIALFLGDFAMWQMPSATPAAAAIGNSDHFEA